MDRNYLYQVDIREWIENGLDAEIMVPVFGNRVDKKYDVYLQSFLLPIDAVESDMQNDTQNANTMEPGITVYGSWENDEKVYHRWGNDDDFEPLIIKRNFNGVATDSVEVAEEFRLLFNLYFYTLNIGNTSTGTKRENYSYIFAKNVIWVCSLCDSNIWPYNEEKNYVDFIIGIDENGKEIRHTCNPSCLSNCFGANPTAPHYLTPVYFDAAVLNKYYSKPEIYKVEDGIIRCGVLWSLYIDNSNSEYVSAYLGDLGRDLPSESEQHYWRGFNKAVGGKLSPTKVKRDFMCIASDSESPDFVFKRTYRRVNQAYEDRLGWPLFLPLTEQDTYNFETLRVPVNNSIAEMDMLVLSLVKILIDSLNEKKITSQLTGSYEKLVGSMTDCFK